jgi:hypothetical protein
MKRRWRIEGGNQRGMVMGMGVMVGMRKEKGREGEDEGIWEEVMGMGWGSGRCAGMGGLPR